MRGACTKTIDKKPEWRSCMAPSTNLGQTCKVPRKKDVISSNDQPLMLIPCQVLQSLPGSLQFEGEGRILLRSTQKTRTSGNQPSLLRLQISSSNKARASVMWHLELGVSLSPPQSLPPSAHNHLIPIVLTSDPRVLGLFSSQVKSLGASLRSYAGQRVCSRSST